MLVHAFSRGAVHNTGNSLRSPEHVGNKLRAAAAAPEGTIRALVGHAPYGLCRKHLPDDWRYVTFLREPVDLTLSHYHYLAAPGREEEQLLPTRAGAKYLELPPKMTLEEMLEQGTYIPDNLATRMLYGGESPFGELPADALARAKENLSRFTFVGLTERLDESIVLLGRALGIGVVPYASRKVNTDRPSVDDIPPEQRALIERHNELDLELYAFARNLLETRLKAADDIEVDVAALKRTSVGRDDPEARLLGEPVLKQPKSGRPKRRRKVVPGRSEREGDLIAYVHIPKSAGSTVGSVFRTAFGDRAVNGGNVFRDPNSARARIQRLGARSSARVRAVTGVLSFGPLARALPDGTKYVTVLREPVDRTLSHYHFFVGSPRTGEAHFATREGPRRLPAPTRETSLEEMLERGVYILDNLATRLLYGGESPFGELPKDVLERAKENLERFAFVGLADRLDETIVLLERMLGLGLVPYTSYKVNRDRPRVEEIPDEQRELIERHNVLDLELYAHARDLFEARAADAGDLAEEVERLRSASVTRDRPEAQLQGPVRARQQRPTPRRSPQKGRRPRPGTLVAHVEIPASGRLLLSCFLPYQILRVGDALQSHSDAYTKLKNFPAAKPRTVEAITGTVPVGLLRAHLPEGTRYITMLREPVARTIAHYRSLRHQDNPAGQKLSLAEALGSDGPVPDNLATRLMCGLQTVTDELPPAALEDAKRVLQEEFALVGLVERPEQSLALLQRLLGRELTLYPQTAEKQMRTNVLSEEERRLVQTRNQLDLELYRFARDLFEERVASTPDLESDAEALRAELTRLGGRTRRKAPVRRRPSVTASSRAVYLEIPGTVEAVLPDRAAPQLRHLGDATLDPKGILDRLRDFGNGTSAGLGIGVIPLGALQEHVQDQLRLVTVLRDPVQRVLSQYYALIATRAERPEGEPEPIATREGPRLLPPLTPELPLARVLEDGLYLLDNLATRLLSGASGVFEELPADALDRAMQNLEEWFEVVGIAERLSETTALIQSSPGFEGLDLRACPRMPRDGWALVERYNQLDVNLYRFAAKLFQRHVVEQGADFKNAVRHRERLSLAAARESLAQRFPALRGIPSALLEVVSGTSGSTVRSQAQRIIRGGSGVPGRVLLFGFDADALTELEDIVHALDVRPGNPPLTRFENLIFRPRSDCLYDEAGKWVPETSTFRGPYLTEARQKAPPIISPPAEMPLVDGPLVFLDQLPRHWGIFLTAGISRVWALAEPEAELPPTTRLIGPDLTGKGGFEIGRAAYVETFLERAGLGIHRFASFPEHVLLREVYVPHPSFAIRGQAFTAHARAPETVAERICGRSLAQRDEPLYLSRSRLRRGAQRYYGEEALEDALVKAGVRVVYPETLPFEEQVRLMNEHSVVVGCIGSAFHSILFALPDRPRRTVVVTNEVSRNLSTYFMIDLLKEIEANYVFVEPLDRRGAKARGTLDVEATLSWLSALSVL